MSKKKSFRISPQPQINLPPAPYMHEQSKKKKNDHEVVELLKLTSSDMMREMQQGWVHETRSNPKIRIQMKEITLFSNLNPSVVCVWERVLVSFFIYSGVHLLTLNEIVVQYNRKRASLVDHC